MTGGDNYMEPINESSEAPIAEVADIDRERYETVREEVDRKTDSIYVQNRLSEAECSLEYWLKNRDVIKQIITALEEAASQEIGESFFSRIGNLLMQIQRGYKTRYDLKTYTGIVRRRYERDGMSGIKKYVQLEVCMGFAEDPISNGIEETIRHSEAEVRRITDIIEHNSVQDAASRLYIFGACHEIWDIRKRILKTEYGIDWKTPAETHPYIDFD